MSKKKPRIVVLGTGGTIAGIANSPTATATYQAGVTGIGEMIAQLPALAGLAELVPRQAFNIGSKNLADTDLLAIARMAQEALQETDVDGLVITHGTDTLEETAYFLNLVLTTEKPVVLVGAMRPATALSADGPLNLYDGVRTAACPDAFGKGVLVVLNGLIHSGRDIAKQNTTRADAFSSPYGPLGAALENRLAFYRAPLRCHTHQSRFDIARIKTLPEVAIVLCHAGVEDFMIEACVARRVAGLVLAGTGNANYPDRFIGALQRAALQEIALVRASRVSSGSSLKQPDTRDEELKMIIADDQTAPRARLLLALALHEQMSRSDIQTLFETY